MAKILIVDDEKDCCETLKDILETKGYSVDSVHSGKDAILKVKEGDIDIILMDIKMPVMNGVEAFKEIKKINPKVVVIMMTAYSVEDLIKEALAAGAFGVIRKPLDVDKLLEHLELAKNKGMFVLVTDDDPNTRQVLKDILQTKGYRVSLAENGEDAIRIVEQRPQDILIIDMKLPTLNGLETYLELKKRNPLAVAIIITGFYEETKDLVDLAVFRGAYTCLQKPLDMDKILKVLDEIVQKKAIK